MIASNARHFLVQRQKRSRESGAARTSLSCLHTKVRQQHEQGGITTCTSESRAPTQTQHKAHIWSTSQNNLFLLNHQYDTPIHVIRANKIATSFNPLCCASRPYHVHRRGKNNGSASHENDVWSENSLASSDAIQQRRREQKPMPAENFAKIRDRTDYDVVGKSKGQARQRRRKKVDQCHKGAAWWHGSRER